MKEAAQFLLDYMVTDAKGHLITGPSLSPENRYKLPDGTNARVCMGPTMDTQIAHALFTRLIAASEILGVEPDFRAAARGGARQAHAAEDRQARPDHGVARGLRRAGSRPPAHLAAVRAESRQPDHAARHAGAGEGGARDARSPPGQRRRPYRLEPRLDHQLLGAPRGCRQDLREHRGAAGQVDAAEPARHASAVPDRRQLRRHGGHRRDAPAEPRRRDRDPAGAARRRCRTAA